MTLTALRGPDSFAPTVAFREQLWRVSYSRCADDVCSASRVYYEESAGGENWSDRDPVSAADHGPHAVNGGVTAAGRILVLYGAGEADGDPLELWVRRTAAID